MSPRFADTTIISSAQRWSGEAALPLTVLSVKVSHFSNSRNLLRTQSLHRQAPKDSRPNDYSSCAHSAKLNLKSLISCAIGYLCGHDIDHVGNLTKLMPLHGQRQLLQKGHTLIYAVNISFGSLDPINCVSGSMFA